MFSKKPSAIKNEPEVQENQSTYGTQKAPSSTSTTQAKGAKTRIIVKYDVGFNNTLFIRGQGGNLSWDRGTPMKNIKNDEWLWETDSNIPQGEFKVLINDRTYETGPNHTFKSGTNIQFTPRF